MQPTKIQYEHGTDDFVSSIYQNYLENLNFLILE